MARDFFKRILTSLLAVTLLFSTVACKAETAKAEAAAATGVDFSISASLNPLAFEQPDMFIKSLEKALSELMLKGHIILANGQADITGDLMLNGLSAVDFHLTGWEERLSLQTSLFGEKPVLLTMANYMPYLVKVYDYFGIPLQYVGVFTDLYSYKYGFLPFMDVWKGLTGGTESRSYTAEECVQMAGVLSSALDQDANQAFFQWRRGLLQYVTLDELVNEFIYALPDWAAGITQNGGLDIAVSGAEETWTFGGETVYRKTSNQDNTFWEVNIPEWEGYKLAGKGDNKDTENGLNANMEWNLYESGELYGFANISATGLPDGKHMQGSSRITISLGGESLGVEQTFKLALSWDQQQQNEKSHLNCRLSLLHPETEKEMMNLQADISWYGTQESFPVRTVENINGLDFFCMNDITIREFFHDAKGPLMRSAIPFVLELPAGFWNGVADWMNDNGMLVTLMDSLKGAHPGE